MTNFICAECGTFSLPKGEFVVECPGCRTKFEWFAFSKDRKGNTIRTRLERWLGYQWMAIRGGGVASS